MQQPWQQYLAARGHMAQAATGEANGRCNLAEALVVLHVAVTDDVCSGEQPLPMHTACTLVNAAGACPESLTPHVPKSTLQMQMLLRMYMLLQCYESMTLIQNRTLPATTFKLQKIKRCRAAALYQGQSVQGCQEYDVWILVCLLLSTVGRKLHTQCCGLVVPPGFALWSLAAV